MSVELATLVVEAVSEFVTDDSADAAKVHSIVCLVVVKRRLQNSRREGNVIQLRIVTGIDGAGWIGPVILVHGLANFI